MLSIRDFSIKNKLISVQVFTSVLVLGLCFSFFLVSSLKGYKTRKLNSTIAFAQVIGSNSASAIQFLDNDAAKKFLATLPEIEPDIINASILDKNGKMFADYIKPGGTDYVFKPPYTDSYSWVNDNFLRVYKSIFKNNEFLGTVCLQVELSELGQIKAESFQIAAILLAVGLALSFIIANINQRYISKPILSLVSIIENIRRSGDYNRHVPVVGKDEIAALSLEFNNLMDQITISHQKKDEFIGIASHELKTPLTSIKGFLELLRDSEMEDPKKMFVERALGSTQKLHDLVLDLLDVSKIQAGQLQLNIQKFNIDELVDECISNIRITTKKHTIIKKSNPSILYIFADRHRIEQVIVNLLSNAIKYSPHDTDIIVQVKQEDSKVIVSVQDFGIGIPKSEQERIFDRFYRPPGRNIGISGFGLGLYICAQIVKRHNGTIRVESEEEKGSTFYLELPLRNNILPG